MQIAMIAAEIAPAASTGGLGDVMAALPNALARLGHEVHLFVPLYRGLRAAFGDSKDSEERVLVEVRLHDGIEEAHLRRGPAVRGTASLWGIEADRYFDRAGLFGEGGSDYGDNDRRFAFFARAALGALARLGLEPEVLHLHDWHVAPIAAWLRHGIVGEDDAAQAVRRFADRPVVLTVHNLAHQGLFPVSSLAVTGLPRALLTSEGVEFHGRMSFLKAGLISADRIIFPSPGYAREVRQPEGGFGLDGIFAERAGRLEGILNGIDDVRFDPAGDPALVASFDRDELSGRRRCKADLLVETELNGDLATPIVGMVARLGAQKGFDLVLEALPELLERGLRLVILGTGDLRIAHDLRRAVARWPGQVAFREAWDETLARKIYAGADFFLMPSRWEPCGISQMIALRYGAVPVVHATGGLMDTVLDMRRSPAQGTGFWIERYERHELLAAFDDALEVRADPIRWQALVRRGMSRDFSWRHSALRHAHLYATLLSAGGTASAVASPVLDSEGWQEEIGGGLDRRMARALARAFADWIGDRAGGAAASGAGVIIASDGRFLSPELCHDAAGALVLADVPVVEGGVASGPALSLAVRQGARAGGVFVTGGARGSEQSGLRLIDAWGGPLLPAARARILADARRRLDEPGGAGTLSPEEIRQIGRLEAVELEALHEEVLAGAINHEAIAAAARRGLTIVLDHAHGPGARLVERQLLRAGVPTQALRAAPDALLGGLHGAWRSDAAKRLAEAVGTAGATLGIGLSPEGGLSVLVDGAGRTIPASRASALLLKHLLGEARAESHALPPGAVARTVTTTRLVDAVARRMGRRVVEAPRGFAELGHLLYTGEAAVALDEIGGLSAAGLATDRDGAFAALLAVEMLAGCPDLKLEILEAGLLAETGPLFLKRRDAEPSSVGVARLAAMVKQPPSRVGSWRVEAAVALDGLQLLLEGGRWVVLAGGSRRAAATLELWAEAPDEREAWALLDAAEQLLRPSRTGMAGAT